MSKRYVPQQDSTWLRQSPAEAGFDPEGLSQAIAFARDHGTTWPMDIAAVIEGGAFDPPPWNCVLGPTQPRGGPCGMILVDGRIVAEWGDVGRVDMIFSVAKSYLGLVAGVAVDAGLIGAIADPVRLTCPHPALDHVRTKDVSWLHLLQQTSELEVELWGIPDSVDRNRQLSPQEDGSRYNRPHTPAAPGSVWDYNDVRVNFLCLVLTRLFGRSLEDVLREAILDPLDGTPDWRWWGLHGGAIDIRGLSTPCVVGGGHWGGGLVTSARHDARVGLLVSRGGVWGGSRVVSREWLTAMLTPGPLNPVYGALWWLNTDHILHVGASAGSMFALGVGMNAIWVDAARDLVVVVRWLDRLAFDPFVTMVASSFVARDMQSALRR